MQNIATLNDVSATQELDVASEKDEWFPSVSQVDLTRDGVQVALEGAVPEWLKGRLVRTAPALFESGNWRAEHWFDGLGMLYSFELEPEGVRFAQRKLESSVAEQVARDGRIRTASFATKNQRPWWQRLLEPIPRVTDNANVNVVRMGSEWVAMTESPHQLVIDERTLGVAGRVRYEDAFPPSMGMTAHPHFDFERNLVVNLGVLLGRNAEIVAYDHAPSSRVRREIGRVTLPELPYVHSFGLTRDHVVVVGHPFATKPHSLLWSNRGFIDHFTWAPERGTKLYVLDRNAGSGAPRAPRIFETDAFFTFHVVNAFQEGGDIVLDTLAYDDANAIDEFRVATMRSSSDWQRPRLVRIRMLQNGKTQLETLSTDRFEFPSINYRARSGSRHRFVWGATAHGDGADVVRFDSATGKALTFGVRGYRFGEPVFVARPGAAEEDDGVLLTTGSTERSSMLAVLDARSLEPRALARADLPIPLGFHGSFARA
jgi:beta,beta-carotene 9',10'-dioxygenase